MFSKKILTEYRNNHAILTLNRPEVKNAIDMEMMEELNVALQEIRLRPELRAVVLTGKGDTFCAGGDLKEMKRAEDKYSFLRLLSKTINANTLEIRSLEVPVIAAVNGPAMGAGFCLTEVCDFVIAVEGAVFNASYVNVGLAPGCGTFHLPRLVGLRKAMEIMLLARNFTAQEALEWGLVNRVVPEERLWAEVGDFVRQIASKPVESLKITKAALYKSLQTDIHGQIENESQAIAEAGLTRDFIERVDAFLNRRKLESGKRGRVE